MLLTMILHSVYTASSGSPQVQERGVAAAADPIRNLTKLLDRLHKLVTSTGRVVAEGASPRRDRAVPIQPRSQSARSREPANVKPPKAASAGSNVHRSTNVEGERRRREPETWPTGTFSIPYTTAAAPCHYCICTAHALHELKIFSPK